MTDSLNNADKEVGKDLVKGTLIAGATGATVGAVLGIMRQQPVPSYAFSGGLNASLFGMTFIAFRESFLRFQRSKNPYFGLKDSQTLAIDELWSSTVAGAFTGGILSALARGPKAVPSGTFMFGAMACGGQWIYSKASRYRQSKILAANPDLESTFQEKNKDSVGTGLLNVLPVHRTDVDDYETRLRAKLRNIELEQKMLEEEVLRRKRAATQVAIDNINAFALNTARSNYTIAGRSSNSITLQKLTGEDGGTTINTETNSNYKSHSMFASYHAHQSYL